ncbi:hypothetical protein MCOR34_006614 [Pyricularia oryzae]|nr:hypothetical protein MCOR34_006614 [Pyricularia oryzae]KAI6580646.1 hypothetical protein MCOR04_005679 [Pyricularia oryzae]
MTSIPYRKLTMSAEAGSSSDQSVTQKTPKTVRAVFHDAVGKVSVRHVPFPELKEPEDAIVRITTSAICGSDLHNYRGFYGPENYPYRAGHEAMGVVHKIGPAVDSLKVGDRVVIAFPDDHPIRTENTTVPDIDFFFDPEFGLQTEYARVPFADSSLIPIPNRLPDKEWLFLGDIFTTGWMALNGAGFEAGDSVAVFGAGPVGLMAAYSACIRGASRIYVVDHVQQRLDKAREIGPGVVPIDFTKPGQRASEQILTLDGGCVNRAVDCVGQECLNRELVVQQDYVLRECVAVTAAGGGVGVAGVHIVLPPAPGRPNVGQIQPEILFGFPEFWLRGLKLGAVLADPAKMAPTLSRLVDAGRARPGFIVDEGPFDLDEAPELYRRFNEQKIIKVLFKGAPRPEEWEEWEKDEVLEDFKKVNGH